MAAFHTSLQMSTFQPDQLSSFSFEIDSKSKFLYASVDNLIIDASSCAEDRKEEHALHRRAPEADVDLVDTVEVATDPAFFVYV